MKPRGIVGYTGADSWERSIRAVRRRERDAKRFRGGDKAKGKKPPEPPAQLGGAG